VHGSASSAAPMDLQNANGRGDASDDASPRLRSPYIFGLAAFIAR